MNKRTRMELRRDRIIAAAWTLLLLAAMLLFLTGFSEPEEPAREARTLYVMEGGPSVQTVSADYELLEDIDEAAKSEAAVMAAIGTDRELETFGYNVTLVLQIVTAEAGTDARQCRGVMQALFNACILYDSRYTPEEMCEKYRYTHPANWVSDEATEAFCEIFVQGKTFEDIGAATVFYNPDVDGPSAYHEGQVYVCSIEKVRYFEER